MTREYIRGVTVGKQSLSDIKKNYHPINVNGRYVMYEHNIEGEEEIVVHDIALKMYCYTEETFDYTIRHKEEFCWYRLKPEYR